jgi:hypothetical protein
MRLKRLILPTIMLFVLIGGLAISASNAQISSIQSSRATVTPDIDGTFNESEWADATHLSFNHTTPSPGHDPDFVHIYIKNTDNKLYLLFDDLPDNTSELDDHLWVFFDSNWDNVVDENITMYLDRDHDPGDVYGGDAAAEWILGFGPSPNKATDHTIIEVAINITLAETYDGISNATELSYTIPLGVANNTIRIMFSASVYICGWEIPQDGVPNDATTYAVLTLAIVPFDPLFIIVGVVVAVVVIAVVVVYFVKLR